MNSLILFGIQNCDQVRKAKVWLTANAIPFTFHDFRVGGISQDLLDSWLIHLPWDSLINRRGTTWRQLSDEQRKSVVDQASACALLLANPTLIKRPVVICGETVLVGFNGDLWATSLISAPEPNRSRLAEIEANAVKSAQAKLN